MRYVVLTPPHEFLSDDARALDLTVQTQHVELAEDLLAPYGLRVGDVADVPRYDDAGEARARRAVAMQVSFQAASGVDAFVLSSEGIGPLSSAYRGGIVHPQAVAIVQGLPLIGGGTTVARPATSQATPITFTW